MNDTREKFTAFTRKLEKKIRGAITLPAAAPYRGCVLLSYITAPFFLTKTQLESVWHTNYWECVEIARILQAEGFQVDVIDWNNTSFVPRKPYTAVIDLHQNLERWVPLLPATCKKIHFIDGAHWLFQNHAEYTRLYALQQRRGCTIAPRRVMFPNRNIESADLAIGLGNEFTRGTYAFAKKTIHSVPLSTSVTFPSPEERSFDEYRNHFVWIGGGGAVHKGLDLVLEAFATLPDHHLTVCGPVQAEKDFVTCYHTELFESPNIHTVGRIPVHGQQFKNIIQHSIGMIHPSCSEGQSGAVITAMHAGLIPIVSYESGVDVQNFGIILPTSSVQAIHGAVLTISKLPTADVRLRAVRAWEYARTHHTRYTFHQAFTARIRSILP